MKTESAKCAKMIKGILKNEFPKIKFSVKSSNFSMGNSVDVVWTDGPTTEEVDKKIKHFQYGHFDGMTDCYEYSNTIEDIPQTKYLSTRRELSEEFRDAIAKAKEIKRNPDSSSFEGSEKEHEIWKLSQEIDWTDKGHIETLEEEFYRKEKEMKEWEKENSKIVASIDRSLNKLKEEAQ